MSSTTWFSPLSAEAAPIAARPMLQASAQKFGFIPSPVARTAHSAVALKHLLAGFGAFDQTSLSPIEREVIAMTVAFENECHYCMAMHSAMLARSPEHADLVASLRAGTPVADPRLEALRLYTRAVVRERGRVPAELAGDLERAGFSEAQAVEIVLGIGVYMLSTLLNIVTQAELDAPFVPFAWQRP